MYFQSMCFLQILDVGFFMCPLDQDVNFDLMDPQHLSFSVGCLIYSFYED